MTKKPTTSTEAPAFPPDWLEVGADRARQRVDEAKERGADLVAAWIAGKNAGAVAAVAADDGAPAAARKAARRGINVLKSRGIAIPEPPREKRAPVAPVVATYEAWFRPPNAAGTTAFTVGARGAGGRYRLVDVILQDGKGLVSAAGMEMSRTQLRETFDGIEQRFGHGPAPVPIAWARARIAAARAENASHGTPLPLGLDQHDDLLNGAPASVAHPADEMNLALPSESEALARTGTLHAEPELRGWLPEPAAMQDLLRRIDDEKESLRGADRATTEAKIVAIVELVTDAYFTAAMREKTHHRMKDAAISLIARGETSRAADLLVAARAVAAKDPVPHAIPFLRGFFEKAFGLAAARAARQPAV
jgi:hypothetical protein